MSARASAPERPALTSSRDLYYALADPGAASLLRHCGVSWGDMMVNRPTPSPARAPRMLLALLVGLVALLVLALGALTWVIQQRPVEAGRPIEAPPLEVGRPAPEFRLELPEGGHVTLSELRGRPVWLNFWATNCAPCRAEMPDLSAAGQDAARRGVRLLAVNVGEKPATVGAYIERAGLQALPVALDEGYDTAVAYRVYYMPTHVFIDSAGIVRTVATERLTLPRMLDEVRALR